MMCSPKELLEGENVANGHLRRAPIPCFVRSTLPRFARDVNRGEAVGEIGLNPTAVEETFAFWRSGGFVLRAALEGRRGCAAASVSTPRRHRRAPTSTVHD